MARPKQRAGARPQGQGTKVQQGVKPQEGRSQQSVKPQESRPQQTVSAQEVTAGARPQSQQETIQTAPQGQTALSGQAGVQSQVQAGAKQTAE